MKSIYNAVYFIIFLAFVRKITDKIKVPFTTNIKMEHHDSSDEFYVAVNDITIFWSSDQDEATAFVWSAIARETSLVSKLKVIESGTEYVLQSVESVRGLTPEQELALNQTIDEFE